MPAFFDSLWYALPFVDRPVPTRIVYPEGAYVPQASDTAAIFGKLTEAGGGAHPVMDAAQAQAHNAGMFHGALSWGPVMGLALVVFAWLWTRWQRN